MRQGHPGQYRTIQNYIVRGKTGEVIYPPPTAGDVPEMMRELIDWLATDTDIHPVLIAGIAQFQLVYIHHFVDGNGVPHDFFQRFAFIGQATTLSDSSQSANTTTVIVRLFYNALQQVRENNMDLTGWLDYFTSGLATQLDEVKAIGTQAIQADLLIQNHDLNDRQAEAIKFLVENQRLAIADMEQICPGVNRRTLQRDLK